ncbi:class II fructose-bisphosphate aldolase [Clostridium sp. AF19-22AC]|jgi:fructose-bisphosphate aldolase class II|uniref:class II fructose-bisphosphate aldolase n=1 Tax=Clostridia TaxID=186801 RepID=UPI000E47B5CD|nr:MULTISPECIES: class II fructose-bisphosphate aldolase [Clostridia]RHR30273.1 class II fructose-bisphosphate aldolase [Clostridium sp. AF19-22AC]
MLVTLKEILSESVTGKYAVGAFDTMNPVFTEGILAAAETKNVPVIIMVCDYSFTMPNAENFMRDTIEKCRSAKVPVCVHLDHGPSIEAVMQAIHYGCTSVMIDGSSLPFQENIKLTKKVVELAHMCGVSVEAEIGHVAGHEAEVLGDHEADETAYTRLEDAATFYEATGVDALAVAIGTVHGIYKGEPKLNYERLKKLREALPCPLVMHGGSGLSPEHFKKAIECGINKVNFYTGMAVAAADVCRNYLMENERADMTDVLEMAEESITGTVEKHLDIFGTKELVIRR